MPRFVVEFTQQKRNYQNILGKGWAHLVLNNFALLYEI